MRGMSAYIIQRSQKVPSQVALEAQAPLLNAGRWRIWINGAHAHPTQQSRLIRIKRIGGEAVLQQKEWRRCRRRCRLYVVHDERCIQRELVLAAESLKKHVVNSVTATQHGLRSYGVGDPDARSEIALIPLHQRALFDGSIRSE